jgi:hypothetical protein
MLSSFGFSLLQGLLALAVALKLRSKRSKWATIVDARTGLPIPEATVSLFSAVTNQLIDRTLTTKNGEAQFKDQPAGSYYLIATKRLFAETRSEVVVLGVAGAPSGALTIPVTGGGSYGAVSSLRVGKIIDIVTWALFIGGWITTTYELYVVPARVLVLLECFYVAVVLLLIFPRPKKKAV